ncbi:MAG TPA: Ig-like domain-containing protein [Bryobacteraceae bacterium]|nr:Ig-like domain-containing protein [Bryobacteraceae bacterium]
MFRRFLLSVCLFFPALTPIVRAQNVFSLPGASSTGQNVSVFGADPLVLTSTLSAGAGSFLTVALPDLSKAYIIANTSNATITALDKGFFNAHNVANLTQPATGAILTPDGRRLIVLTVATGSGTGGTVHVFDTSTDVELVQGGLTSNYIPTDIAVSFDSTRAYVLNTTTNIGSILSAIDTGSGQNIGNLTIQGQASGVTLAPNGLLYVSTRNLIEEIDPSHLAVTTNGSFSFNAYPGKLVFTPDGRFGLAVNQTPITGSAILSIDLANRTPGPILSGFGASFNTALDRVWTLDNTQYLAYSGTTSTLYLVTLSGSLMTSVPLSGAFPGNISAVAVTNEVGITAIPQRVYIASGNSLARYDLGQNQTTAQVTLPNPAGALSYVAPAITNGTVATILAYGGNQAIAPGATSNPLIARVLDAQGRPLAGVPVAYTANNASVTFSQANATTNNDGFAFTTVTAAAGSGAVVVTATAGGITANYNITLGSSTSGGTLAGTVSIVAGQGQLVGEQRNTGVPGFGSPLTVLVLDTNGNPLANAQVTYTLVPGLQPGALSLPGQAGGNTITVPTDNTGQAAVNFLTTNIQPGSGYGQSQITAVATNPTTGLNTNTVTFYLTTYDTTSTRPVPPTVNISPFQGSTFSGASGSTQKGAILATVSSSQGVPIPNVSLRILPNPAGTDGATCAGDTGAGVLSDATGTVVCDLVFTGPPGVAQITAEVGYRDDFTYNISVTAGAPAKVVKINGDNQTVNVGQQLPIALRVQVQDAGGTALTGVPVRFAVSPTGSVTLSNVSSATDSAGFASATATAGNTGGSASVTVTAGTGTATFTIKINVPASGIRKISGDNQTAVVGSQFGQSLVVQVVNGQNQAVGGVPVTFAVSSGSASVGSPSTTTDSNGQASTTVTAGAAGSITVTATAAGFSVSFTLTSRLAGPSNLAFLNGASFQPGISAGGIALITGTGIATGISGTVSATTGIGPEVLPLVMPASNGASVSFDGFPAPIYSISNISGAEQIVVQVPFEVAGRSFVQVTVTGVGGGSSTQSVQLQPLAPGIFQTNAFGLQNQAIALHADGTYISPTSPATRGETIYFFATGLGQTSPTLSTNSAGIPNQNVTTQLVVGINNGGANLVSAQTVTGQVGVYIIAMQLPADTATGPSQPVGLVALDAAGNSYFAASTFIPIQ